MNSTVIAVVLAAGLLHALWNAIAKNMDDKFATFALLNVGVAVVSWAAWPFVGMVATRALPYVAVSTLVHISYEILLMGAYRRGDFSQSYTIARGVAPLLVSVGGFVFASEHLGERGLLGVVGIAAGIISLMVRRGALSKLGGIYWALACGVSIAVYSVLDGLGVRAAHSTLRYAALLFVAQSTVWLIGVGARRDLSWWPGTRVAALGVLGGVMSIVGYSVGLWPQGRAPRRVVSALRETGVLWAALIGVVVFREGKLRRIMIPACLVVVGIALLSVA